MATARERWTEQDEADALMVLEPAQLVGARLRPFGRRQLSLPAQIAMWGLRIYAVLMLFVVMYYVVRVIQTGA